jgi:hypothetical protein
VKSVADASNAACRGLMRALLGAVAAIGVATTLSGCGGGVEVAVEDPPPPPVTALSIRLARVGPEAVQVEWSDDPDVNQYTVYQNGYVLANVMATSVIDTTVTTNVQYCYQVSGYSLHGDLLATTDSACIVLAQ